jgi:hypothetical protein
VAIDTASWANNAVSSSWASMSLSSSWANNAVSAAYAPTVTTGLTNTTKSWWDAITSTTQSMYIDNGLVISWSVQA